MKKKYYISLILLSLSICVAGGVYFFMMKGLWAKSIVVTSYKNDLLFAEQKQQHVDALALSLEDIQSDVDFLQTLFVKNQGEVEFIEYVEESAKQQGLEIEIRNVSLDSPSKVVLKGVEYLTLRFEVKGSWVNVWNFSRILEVLPYSVDITSILLVHNDTAEQVDKNKISTWKAIYTIKVLKKK